MVPSLLAAFSAPIAVSVVPRALASSAVIAASAGSARRRGHAGSGQQLELRVHECLPDQKVVLKVRLTKPRSFRSVVKPFCDVTAVPLSL